MGKTLYVGNLGDSVSSSELQTWFTPFGTVQSVQVIQAPDIERSKRFGVVEMDTDAQAEAAIQGLNDLEHAGRWLVVSEAKPREARSVDFAGGIIDGSARTGDGDGYGGGRWHGVEQGPLSSRP